MTTIYVFSRKPPFLFKILTKFISRLILAKTNEDFSTFFKNNKIINNNNKNCLKRRGGNDVQPKNWKGKILNIWITIIRHGGLGHEVQESWPYLSSSTPWPYELSHVKNEFSLVGLTACQY